MQPYSTCSGWGHLGLFCLILPPHAQCKNVTLLRLVNARNYVNFGVYVGSVRFYRYQLDGINNAHVEGHAQCDAPKQGGLHSERIIIGLTGHMHAYIHA